MRWQAILAADCCGTVVKRRSHLSQHMQLRVAMPVPSRSAIDVRSVAALGICRIHLEPLACSFARESTPGALAESYLLRPCTHLHIGPILAAPSKVRTTTAAGIF